MDPQIHMPSPMCLIENRQGRLAVCQDALQLLSRIGQPVVVVAIAGLCRTGKSYLMNKLAGRNAGFPMGSTVQANTKGIWMWCVPHPGKPDRTLVLLDTEGLGDVEKGDTKNDTWIFALAVLLSSTFIYNSIGIIDQQAMDKLHYVTELTKHIKVKPSSGRNLKSLEDSAEFVRFFPSFVWALRDFTLQLQLNNKPITEDEYLENALKLKKGDPKLVQKFNLPRECIRLFFPTRKCFVFDRPTNRKNLHQLEEMQESDLEPDFVEQASAFCHYIYETSKKKTIPGGHVVTGRLLANLVVTYVDAICSGEVPCIENAVLALVQTENSAAVHDAAGRYEELMQQKLRLPTETLQDLLKIHAVCEKEAIEVFMARSFKDDTRQFHSELMKALSNKKEEYCKMNEGESRKCCLELLARLSQELEDKIKNGKYAELGSYQKFLTDLQAVTERYRREPGKGVMAEEVLYKFLQDKDIVGKAILQNDKALSEKQRKIEEAKAQVAAAEREQELQKQQLALVKEQMEDLKRSFEVNMQELKIKMENDRKNLLEEQNKMLDCKLKEQEKMLEEGFHKCANQLSEEIEQLKWEKENILKPWLSGIGDSLPGLWSVSFQKGAPRTPNIAISGLSSVSLQEGSPHTLSVAASELPSVSFPKGGRQIPVAASGTLEREKQHGFRKVLPPVSFPKGARQIPVATSGTLVREKLRGLLKGQRSTWNTETPADPWEGIICDQCGCEEKLTTKIVPFIDLDSEMCETYRLVMTGAGSFHCCYTNVIFEVTKAVTITYRVDLWYKHLENKVTMQLNIAGPLFNIQADPIDAVAAVHFPHFLCLAGEDHSEVQIAHFSEGVMSLDKPDSVGPFHAVLKNPTFSPRGVFKLHNKKTKIHAMALLYHLRTSGSSAHTFHLYLLPNDPCLKKAVDNCEQNYHSQRVPKPPGICRPLRMGSLFFVRKSDDIAVIPRTYILVYLDPDMEQQYFEVYAERMKDKLELNLMEKQNKEEELVWEACLREEELTRSAPSLPAVVSRGAVVLAEESPEPHFVESYREQLIQHTRCVNAVLDNLHGHAILSDEQYQKVLSKTTSQDKMRELYLLLPSWNCSCKDLFYKALKSSNRFLIDELEKKMREQVEHHHSGAKKKANSACRARTQTKPAQRGFQ